MLSEKEEGVYTGSRRVDVGGDAGLQADIGRLRRGTQGGGKQRNRSCMRLTLSDIVLNFSSILTEKVLDYDEHDPCHVTVVPNVRRCNPPLMWPFTTKN